MEGKMNFSKYWANRIDELKKEIPMIMERQPLIVNAMYDEVYRAWLNFEKEIDRLRAELEQVKQERELHKIASSIRLASVHALQPALESERTRAKRAERENDGLKASNETLQHHYDVLWKRADLNEKALELACCHIFNAEIPQEFWDKKTDYFRKKAQES
jgi:hypothetical protein